MSLPCFGNSALNQSESQRETRTYISAGELEGIRLLLYRDFSVSGKKKRTGPILVYHSEEGRVLTQIERLQSARDFAKAGSMLLYMCLHRLQIRAGVTAFGALVPLVKVESLDNVDGLREIRKLAGDVSLLEFFLQHSGVPLEAWVSPFEVGTNTGGGVGRATREADSKPVLCMNRKSILL